MPSSPVASVIRFVRGLLAFAWLVVPAASLAATFTKIGDIPATDDGGFPASGLVRFDGAYYGTTFYGGLFGRGAVYRVNGVTGAETLVHSFATGTDGTYPQAGLLAHDGKLYGTTAGGGANGRGTVFAVDPATGTEAVVASLPDQYATPASLVALGGLLYGSDGFCGNRHKSGCIFTVDPASGVLTEVFDFQSDGRRGSGPGNLHARNGNLFGTTAAGGAYGGGTLFRFSPASGDLHVAHDFGAAGDGSRPAPTLAALGGLLYGVTSQGGDSNDGTIFSFQPDERQELLVHSMTAAEGSDPVAGLASDGTVLYGVTQSGGGAGLGTVFAFDPQAAQVRVTYSFTSDQPLSSPNLPIAFDGVLYGTAAGGGAYADGAVFSVGAATGQLTILHQFHGTVVSFNSALTKAGSAYYGVASGAGRNALGSIFKVKAGASVVATSHDFGGSDGADPMGGLLQSSGLLYGTTASGGATGQGTLFSFDPVGGEFATLHMFAGSDGTFPDTALTVVNGKAYGATGSGGANDMGVIYSLDLGTASFTKVADLDENLFNVVGFTLMDGVLYGAATSGAGYSGGGIFRLDRATGRLTLLYSWEPGNGNSPRVGLCALGGLLYGVTDGGGGRKATLFKFDPATKETTTLHTFSNGVFVEAPLTAQGGRLFGTILYGYKPALKYGGVFRLDPSTGAVRIFPVGISLDGGPDAALLPVAGGFLGTAGADLGGHGGSVFKFVP